MVYITQLRASSNALSAYTRGHTQAFDEFVPFAPSVQCGVDQIWSNGSKVGDFPLYNYGNGSYGGLGGVVGRQETYSWRTGKVLDDALPDGDRVLTGEEIYRAIQSGKDVDITHNPRFSDIEDGEFASDLRRFADSYDTGHNFWTNKSLNNSNIRNVQKKTWKEFEFQYGPPTWEHNVRWWGPGPTLAKQTPPFATGISVPNQATRLALGSKLMNRVVPTRPYVDVVRAIGELIKDGLPFLVGASLLKSLGGKGVAGEYLNLQFAVMPTVSDARKIFHAVVQSRDILRAYNDSSGKFTHRETVIKDEPSSELVVQGKQSLFFPYRTTPTGGQQSFAGVFDTTDMQVTWLRRSTSEQKFSGTFTYAVPEGGTVLGRFDKYADEAKKLLGMRLDSSVAYDLTPFSWLLDWAVDFGTVFSNAELFNQNNLVMKYGYVMQHLQQNVSATVTGLKLGGKPFPAIAAVDIDYSYKSRDRATPFGFALDTDTFTTFQWSILAALGLSRGRNVKLREIL